MSRFSFSQKFGSRPSTADYSAIKKDFEDYLNTGSLTKDNLESESIRFRHLAESPVGLKFKDCSDAIWASTSSWMNLLGKNSSGGFDDWEIYSDTDHLGSGAGYYDNNCYIKHESPANAPDGNVLQFTFWYYPYQLHSVCRVAPAILSIRESTVDGVPRALTWSVMTGHARRIGSGAGFFAGLESNPYSYDRDRIVNPIDNWTITPSKASRTRETECLGTVAYGGPVSCTITIPKEGLYHNGESGNMHLSSSYKPTHLKPEDIVGYGMAVRIPRSSAVPSGDEYSVDYDGSLRMISACTTYDRLFMSLVTKDKA